MSTQPFDQVRNSGRQTYLPVHASRSRPVRVVLVEDSERILAHLAEELTAIDNLRIAGTAATEAEALQLLEPGHWDLAILDLQLPDGDGLDLCRSIRKVSPLPIVIVTARDEEIDRITGLELGADDYVTKPFSPRELIARVRAVLRRAEPETENGQLAAGDVVVEKTGRTVSVAGSDVELTGIVE